MSRVLAWLLGLALVVGAGVVVLLEPGEQVRQSPFTVETSIGDDGVGRNIQVEFADVRLAEAVDIEGEPARTNGVWLVVDIAAMTVSEPSGMQSFLLIDGLEYRGSERLGIDGIESERLAPGIPRSGSILFEIPRHRAEVTTDARILIGNRSDWRADSVIGITVDLTALVVEPEVEARLATWEAP